MMLCNDQSLRLSVSEILQHSWMNGEKATHEEVKVEMERRINRD